MGLLTRRQLLSMMAKVEKNDLDAWAQKVTPDRKYRSDKVDYDSPQAARELPYFRRCQYVRSQFPAIDGATLS
ncbi:uncharacterized protein Dyak_GE27786 [Drosophila yakuba]|uniref:Uncharacterized protein n=1 Tax=Drosophila yakuba TaxID=7245 RepID=A0A0R1EFG1_DROYA|nr:uncharacterized protein Dyak_GE27786 [Drosophila yakuba]